ncbi:hypothetical protein EDF56_11659 [Novosphingobium sp. PhB165]|nr:hypothetical protein EDF56_11659 [Novosphingobium sp. PhB165]
MARKHKPEEVIGKLREGKRPIWPSNGESAIWRAGHRGVETKVFRHRE